MAATPRNPQLLASVTFEPYIPGGGPIFGLSLTDTGRRDEYHKHVFHYKLTITDPEHVSEDCVRPPQTRILFEGEDFNSHYRPNSKLHDLNSVIRGIMGFLTLKPGDTDREYFRNYTEEQREYCRNWAEALSLEVMLRYGED